ncbi:transcriptional regulator, TetR family [Gemmobacter megaterium]|uniref:Transcriptional regulator, TetR family n=1 Tax=Gemmobacter megaterium TaxID=1086013 RepID=A0A1N7NDL4_9RHOB|nr:TetR/AcrR family transcriptional regulator [Gemmobacter megaterium]GGE14499.1 TetR family transcriptional regulator [Gemmobacter megaterium]SIS96445.1 transcriptional regulator, TetR family [Gemmobacter megaterium]
MTDQPIATPPPNDPRAYTTDALCRLMLERNRATIRVQKTAFALPKLERIVTAALELSNSQGFQAMSLRDLSAASGVSMGGMYAYFDGKTTLLRMILSEVTAAVTAVLASPPDHLAQDPREHLMWLIDSHLHLTETMLPWFVFAFMEAKSFPPSERRQAVDSEIQTERYFAEVIARGLHTGCFRPETSPLLPALIKPLLQEWYVKRAKYHRRGVCIETYIATVQDIVLSACATKG